MPSLENTLMIWGNVLFTDDGEPEIVSGTGNYTILGEEGRYTINFDSAFTDIPTVVMTQIYNDGYTSMDPKSGYGGSSTLDNAVVIAVSANKFCFITGDNKGSKTNRMFSFLVVGPGSQQIEDPGTQIAYGNIGYIDVEGTPAMISGGDGVTLWQYNGSDAWELVSGAGPVPGAYGIKLNWTVETQAVDTQALVVQQIFAGKSYSDDLSNFEYPGKSSTLNNAVLDSVSVSSQDLNIVTAGNNDGYKMARIIGFIAVSSS